MRQVARVAFWSALTLAGLALLWAFREAAALLLLSIVIASAIRPLIDDVHASGLPFRVAVAAAYAASLGVIGLLVYVLAARLLVEIPEAADRLVATYGQHVQQAIEGARGSALAQQALGSTVATLDVIGAVLLVIVMSIYWTGGRDAFERHWLSLLPIERRRHARSVWIATRRAVGAVLRRELGQSVLVAVVSIPGFALAGSELWGLGTVAVLLLRLIPLLGDALAVAAAAATAAPSGLLPAVLASTMTIAVLALLRLVVAPRWFPLDRPLDSILGVLLILALGGSFGVAGLLVAPLVATAIHTACTEIAAIGAGEQQPPRLEDLAARVSRLEHRVRASAASPAVASLHARLQDLLERAR